MLSAPVHTFLNRQSVDFRIIIIIITIIIIIIIIIRIFVLSIDHQNTGEPR